MICLPNRKRARAVSSIRLLVRKRIGAPLTIITSPWRSSNTKLDIAPLHGGFRCGAAAPAFAASGRHACRPAPSLAEQLQQCRRCLVGDRQRLRAQLLLDLQALE